MSIEIESEIRSDWPLWKAVLGELRKLPGFGYGFQVPVSWLEMKLGCKADSRAFAFQMLEIRAEVEYDDGYSLQIRTIHDSDGNASVIAQIPSAVGHEDVAGSWEAKMRRYANRAFQIRERTLCNEAANLSQEDKARMEKASQIAATRIILLRREKSVTEYINKNSPKLLKTT